MENIGSRPNNVVVWRFYLKRRETQEFVYELVTIAVERKRINNNNII